MKRSWLYPLVILVFALFVSACADEEDFDVQDVEAADTVEEPGSDLTWIDAYTAYLEEAMTENQIPGLALALVEGDEVILAEGYGWRNVAAQAPVTADTLFHIGSTHKSMTAMLAATMVDEGQLDWDTPVVAILPSFELSDPEASEQVTMRHLLSMRSGIPDDAEDVFDSTQDSIVDMFALVAETPLLGEPGTAFSYSNISAALAGYLTVLAADPDIDDLNSLYDAYAQLLQDQVLRPIGMTNATMSVSEAQSHPDHALSYTLNANGEPVASPTYDVDGDPLAPSGSLKASAREMGLYVSTQLNRGVAPNGQRVVAAETLAETWQPYLEDYTMGWEVQEAAGLDLILHTGAYDDFISVIGFFPEEEIGFVLLINCEEAGGGLTEEAPFYLAELLTERP